MSVQAPEGSCIHCGITMLVQKTVLHRVITLDHGMFFAKETVRVCPSACTHPSGKLITLRAECLPHLVRPGSVHGYDLEVHIGLERFLRHRQREEIRRTLREEHGISISTGEISNLARRFLAHLHRLHCSRTPELRVALKQDGGYPLHIDATGEDGRGTLFVAYAGWREWVLGAWKIPTERADQIAPHLRRVVADFGSPRAIMRDLGRGVRLAVSELVRSLQLKIPILSCHQHFLNDVGQGLLEKAHDKLRSLFRQTRVRPRLRMLVRELGRKLGTELPNIREEVIAWTEGENAHALPVGLSGMAAVRALAQWVLDSAHDGNHLGFPFEQPYLALYNRARKVSHAAGNLMCGLQPGGAAVISRALRRLTRILEPVLKDPAFSKTVKMLSTRALLFDELRTALRLSPRPSVGESASRSSKETAAELRDIRRALNAFTRSLRKRRPSRGPAVDDRQAIDLVVEHLRRHGESLWGHIITLPRRVGGGIRTVARTNNLLEGFFHRMKHGERRRSGRKVLTDDFERLPAEAALVFNLGKPDYVEIVCGSLENLPGAFAALDIAQRTQNLAVPPSKERTVALPEAAFASLPHADRKVIRTDALRRIIETAARRGVR